MDFFITDINAISIVKDSDNPSTVYTHITVLFLDILNDLFRFRVERNPIVMGSRSQP